MKNITKAAFAAMLAVGGLSVAATSASAAIVCNNDGDCWHVKDHYDYPASYGVVVHDDNWKWEDRDAARYRWREHEGRGYWHDNTWVTF